MSNDTCDGCGSEQLIDFHDRGEVICAICGIVKEVNLEAPWQPGERDPNHAQRIGINIDALRETRDANQIPLTAKQRRQAKRLRYTQQRMNPQASKLLAEIRQLLATEFAHDLPSAVRTRINDILTHLFTRDPSVSAIRKSSSNRDDDDCWKQNRVAYLLIIMTYMNELDSCQLPVPEFERRYNIDRDLLNWMKKRIGPIVQGIIGLESRRLGPNEYRRKQILSSLSLYIAEIEKDEELSRELIQRIRDIALQVLLEWDEPLHGPSVSDTPPHGSKSAKQVVKLAIAEASKRLNSLSSNQKKIIEEALRGPSRRGSSSSTA